MSKALDIELRIRLTCEEEFPVDFVTKAIAAINDCYYRSEVRDLNALKTEYSDLPDVALDAALHRISKHKRSSVLVRAVDKGSIELAIIATGLSIYILQQTIGETIKESWVESGWHKRIKQFLTRRRGRKVEELAESTERKLQRTLPCEVRGHSHNMPLNDNADEGAVIQITVMFRPVQKPLPTRSEVFDRAEQNEGENKRMESND